ncbi:hypothetical protein S40293_00490 [Stachybotrys chartarum IBT 40293]|nr:hypothetical protein S40293_00490 [Stachybotrys chartarum IBT 40293]
MAVTKGSSAGNVLRRLGGMEKYQAAQHLYRYQLGNSLICRYSVPADLARPEKDAELRQAFEEAVGRVVLKHPMLQVGVAGEETRKPVFVELQSLGMKRHVEWRTIDEAADAEQGLMELMVKELDRPFVDLATVQPWRVLVLRAEASRELIAAFIWNHALLDGMSAKMFHSGVLLHLNFHSCTPLPLDENGVLTLPSVRARLPPPMEKMATYTVGKRFAASELLSELRPAALSTKSTTDASWAPIPAAMSVKTRLHSFSVGPDALGRLLGRCRAGKTTVTGLLNALAAVCFARALPAEVAPGFKGVSVVNMRQVTPAGPPQCPWLVPDETMANVVSVQDHPFSPKMVGEIRAHHAAASSQESRYTAALEADVWAAAAAVRQQLVDKLARGVNNDVVGLFKYVPDWRTYIRELARKPRPTAWLVTNLGVLDGNPLERGGDDGWSITRTALALSAPVLNSAVEFGVSSTKGGDMVVVVDWHDAGVDAELVLGIVQDIRGWLDYLAAKE